MNLLILTKNDLIESDRYYCDDYRANHIRKILKSSVGDQLKAGLLDGEIGLATVESISEKQIELKFEADQDQKVNQLEIDLICALPRPQTVKKILILAGTMAVRRIYFIRANRVEKSFYHSPLLTKEKMLPYLIEGLSQGKSTRLPQVSIHERFRTFFEDEFLSQEKDQSKAFRVLLDGDSKSHLGQVLPDLSKRIIAAIGPEGGWVDFEIDYLKNIGFHSCSLGRHTLRVETAVTSLLAQIELLQLQNKEVLNKDD